MMIKDSVLNKGFGDLELAKLEYYEKELIFVMPHGIVVKYDGNVVAKVCFADEFDNYYPGMGYVDCLAYTRHSVSHKITLKDAASKHASQSFQEIKMGM